MVNFINYIMKKKIILFSTIMIGLVFALTAVYSGADEEQEVPEEMTIKNEG